MPQVWTLLSRPFRGRAFRGGSMIVLVVICSLRATSGDELPRPPVQELLDQAGSLLDQVVLTEMIRQQHPGIVIAVACEDRWIVRGYGWSDVDASCRTHPVETRFRVASISKLVTATAIMQLIEQRVIDLDRDANSYLKNVKIAPAFGQPVTVGHLLLHTAGFEDRLVGSAARDPGDLRSLAEYLETGQPKRVYPPGSVVAYSNYGYALLGQIVEDVSGLKFAEYIKNRIFDPLGMADSTFLPLEAGEKGVARGYKSAKARFDPLPVEFPRLGPAAGLTTTARDMALFMLAHLHEGEDQNRILSEETAARMQTVHFRNHPLLPGRGYGFFEERLENVSWIGHAGETLGFNSSLALFPERRFGIFVSANCNGALPGMITASVVTQLFAAKVSGTEPIANNSPPRDLNGFSGVFRTTRHSQSTFEKLAVLSRYFPQVEATVAGHELSIEGVPYQLGPDGDFWQVDGPGRVAFREEEGHVTHLFRGEAAFTRLSFWETPRVHLGILLGVALAGVILILDVTVLVVGRLIWPDRVRVAGPFWPLLASYLSFAFQILAGLALLWVVVVKDPRELAFGMSPSLRVALAAPYLVLILSLIHWVGLGKVWWSRSWSMSRRLQQTFVAGAELFACLLLAYWHLLF